METHLLTDCELNLIAKLEALLFVAPGSVTALQLAQVLDLPVTVIERGLQELGNRYMQNREEYGLRLQSHKDRYQLTSAPEAAIFIERLLGLETSSHLSRPALEVLAIVAYKQPVTRPQIDYIRGVNSDGVLKNLLNKGLIQEIGRAEAPGRPILFGTTSEFLQYFGLNSLDELPPLKEQETDST
jgi:segregation and condensation protein B